LVEEIQGELLEPAARAAPPAAATAKMRKVANANRKGAALRRNVARFIVVFPEPDFRPQL
jgi:hypothetical protein